MPRIVTRAEWDARPPKGTPTIVPLSARTATCIHHDGPTPVTIRSFAEACARVRADQNYHMDHNHWADIGYNYLVVSAPGHPDVDGLIFEGRRRDVVGAHCLNHNTEWIGIQVAIGGGQTPSPAALASTRWLHDSFEVAAKRALGKKVHSDGFPTACPDPKLRAWVKAGMPVPTPAPTTPTPKPTDPFQEDPMDRLIIACYRKFIGREPGVSEVDSWLVLAAQGGLDAKTVAAKIASSPEAKAHAAGK